MLGRRGGAGASAPRNLARPFVIPLRHLFAVSIVSATGITACSHAAAVSLTPPGWGRSVRKVRLRGPSTRSELRRKLPSAFDGEAVAIRHGLQQEQIRRSRAKAAEPGQSG